ncbi:MAG: hypothetical protein IJV37_04400 [Bacteroidales bacterium]|nr:hypothetical protein [Bacteroidales bacterium]
MKKAHLILILLAGVLGGIPAAAQSLCFWTDNADIVPVRIYIDKEYLGDVTAAFKTQPLLDTEGTLGVDTTPERHSITAVDKYGRVYNGWDGFVTPQPGQVVYLHIRGGQFQQVDRSDEAFAFIFMNWVPLFTLPLDYGRVYRGLSPMHNAAPGVGMAVAAIGATAAMGAAAANNWDIQDSRFPYFAIGLGTEYFSSLQSWRNVGRIKARFGGQGGFSLIADAGVAILPDRWSYNGTSTWRDALPDRWRVNTLFTWSVGAGLDYGGLSFSVRYKPAIGNSYDTFLVGQMAYDWWIATHVALSFNVGFGMGGYGENGLRQRYDFPIGFSLLFRL